MKKIINILILIFIASLFSCMNAEIGRNFRTADSLLQEVKKVEVKYNSINRDEIIHIYDTIKQNIDSLNKYMLTLPEVNETSYSLAIFTDVSKQAKHFVKEDYANKIKYSVEQIENLKIDVENNAIESDSVKIYLKSEKDALLELQENVERYSKSAKQIIEKYNNSIDGVNLFIEGLRNTNNE